MHEPDDCVVQLSKDLAAVDERLSFCLPPNRLQFRLRASAVHALTALAVMADTLLCPLLPFAAWVPLQLALRGP